MIKLLWRWFILLGREHVRDSTATVMPYENHHLVCPWHGRINAWEQRGKPSCGCHVEHHWRRHD